MMDAEHHYVYTGEDDDPPDSATHVLVHESIAVIPRELFWEHPNIVELICHDGVIKIEGEAFYDCPRLKRLIMPGVKEVEGRAFFGCEATEHVECKKLEIIGVWAFSDNKSLKSIDLPSVRIVDRGAFDGCEVLTDVKFGINLESIAPLAFSNTALKRITIPLYSDLFISDDIFVGCDDLDQAYLLDEDKATIQETVDAFSLDEWKSDMNKVLDSINQTLPNSDAGVHDDDEQEVEHAGGKTRAIRDWIWRVLRKIIHYKVEHYRLLSLAAVALAHASPNEIVIDNALSFLQLPDHVFEGEGDSSATTPALDRQLWEDIVQLKQSLVEKDTILLEKDTEIASLRSQSLMEKDVEKIASLKAQNDEKEDEIYQLKQRVAQLELQVAESGGVSMIKNGVDELAKKRPRGS